MSSDSPPPTVEPASDRTSTSNASGPNEDEPLLVARDLETIFRTEDGVVRAVDNVDLHINHGEVLGLVGESGAGKSATARSLIRLIESPGEIVGGTVEYKGRDILAMSNQDLREFRSSDVGVIFQDPSSTLNPTHRVGRQVAEAVEQYRPDISSKKANERAVALLDEVGIPNAKQRAKDYPHEFSGGQKQRIVTAIAIACEPELLIADEPTTALDVTVQAQILELLETLRQNRNMSVLFITHDLGVVREICDRTAVMYAGSIVEMGDVEDVFNDPRHPYTKGLLTSIPGLETGVEQTDTAARDAAERLEVIEGTMPDLTDGFQGCKYADRCPGAVEACRREHPPLETIPDSATERAVACIRHQDIDEINYKSGYETRSISWEAKTNKEESTNDAILQVDGLEKHFSQGSFLQRIAGTANPIRAVDGIDIEIDAGETVGLVGESGCGKSTAVRSILRLLEPTDGAIYYRGQNIAHASSTELRELRRNLQIVFQDPQSSLNPRKTVRRLITRPMEVHGIGDERERKHRVKELIDAVGLDQRHLNRYPHELSGGQQQRIGVARALAVNPEVIMLDEPVSGLDVSIQAQILNLLADIQEELHLVYLFISHDLSVVEHVCDRIAVMYLGQIVEYGTVEEVFSPPYHPYTESLLSAIPGAETDQERIVLEGDVPDPSNIPSGCRFHPRCPHKIGDVCETEAPATHTDEDNHQIQCHLMREEYADEIDWDQSTVP